VHSSMDVCYAAAAASASAAAAAAAAAATAAAASVSAFVSAAAAHAAYTALSDAAGTAAASATANSTTTGSAAYAAVSVYAAVAFSAASADTAVDTAAIAARREKHNALDQKQCKRIRRAQDKKRNFQEKIRSINVIVNAYLPEGMQRNVFKKHAMTTMHNPLEKKIGKNNKKHQVNLHLLQV